MMHRSSGKKSAYPVLAMDGAPPRGLLAITTTDEQHSGIDPIGESGDGLLVDMVSSPTVAAASWGIPAPRLGASEAALLCTVARRHEADQSLTQVHEMLSAPQRPGLDQLIPTFAAATWRGGDELCAATDALGFRHLYESQTADWAGVSTSAHLLTGRLGVTFDDEALAVQSQLGWQLGQRTLFSGVRKVASGSVVALSEGRIRTEAFVADPATESLRIETAVADVADMLRKYLAAYLDDHPDAILQLTGGIDSRILLSAIPPARRRGLRIMTLGLPGVPDLDIAADLAGRFGMHHEVITLKGLEDLDHDQVYQRCVAAAIELDCTADPLAYASLSFAEARSELGPRLSGLGGEVARGFYYHGPVRDSKVTGRRAGRLARWRMFANESVESAALDADFGSWARSFAVSEIERVLTQCGEAWLPATDDLYLAHRMQRWGGITETAVCMARHVVNPMLDDRFIATVRRLRPADKHNARFLSRLLVELDADLAAIPLDGRPAPVAYAHRTVRGSAQLLGSDLGKFRRKAVQRIRHVNRPPAGGELLAAKVVEHWQANPSLLEPVRDIGIFEQSWLDGVAERGVVPMSSSVAFLLNVLVAQSVGSAKRGEDDRG
jgi:asparagine synthase (glutamine-hydrolysing)